MSAFINYWMWLVFGETRLFIAAVQKQKNERFIDLWHWCYVQDAATKLHAANSLVVVIGLAYTSTIGPVHTFIMINKVSSGWRRNDMPHPTIAVRRSAARVSTAYVPGLYSLQAVYETVAPPRSPPVLNGGNGTDGWTDRRTDRSIAECLTGVFLVSDREPLPSERSGLICPQTNFWQ